MGLWSAIPQVFIIGGEHMNNKYKYLPEVNIRKTTKGKPYIKFDIIGNLSCPCCEFITVPNNGNVLAYICPVCFWELDLFIHSDGESSDLNHELTLIEARKNCK